MLDAAIAQQISGHLAGLTHPIELVATVALPADAPDRHTKAASEIGTLIDEVAALSDNVTARTDGTATRAPSFIVQRVGAPEVAVEFAGVPMGHEFTSFVLALLQVGGIAPKFDQTTIDNIAALDADFHFETFISLSCQNCPDVVQALNAMSVLNPRITHTMVDGAVFPDEAEQRQVMSVPTVFNNGEVFGTGRMTADEIVAKLDTGAAERAAAELNERDPYEVLIVGGGPAGAAAAIYSARKGIRTGIVTERFGGQVLDTMSIENLISVPHTEGPKLATALETHVNDYDVDIMRNQSTAGLTTETDANGNFTVTLDSGATLTSRSVILSTGASWRSMGVPGEDEYRNKGVTFCPHCDGPLFAGKRVAVIGGGNSGVEAAIDLAGIVEHVTLFEFMPTMRADEVLQAKLKSLPNTDIILNAAVSEVVGDGSQVTGVKYTNRDDDSSHDVALSGVFVQIGLVPNTRWLGDSIELSQRGEIIVDERGATSVPGIFAAGDVTTVPYKQIIISMGHGATAALSAFDHLIRN